MIDVFVAVEVVNAAAPAIFHEERIWLIVAVVAGDAERNPLDGAFVGGRGFRSALFVRGQFFLQCFVHDAAPWSAGLFPALSLRQ